MRETPLKLTSKKRKEQLMTIKGTRPLFLESIDVITIQAMDDPFVAREKFIVGDAGVRISWLALSFRERFLGKNEGPMPETTLCYAKLIEPSVDGPILTELGDKAETTLVQIFALMERQANGEKGVLLTNGGANIFYACDINGELRAVDVYWRGGGWGVLSYPVTHPHGWFVGDRVFSSK